MNKPKITVIMAAYNAQDYIDDAIQSILDQTFKDFEFIVINDASTDGTLEIIKKYVKKDKRVNLIENKKNVGQTKSRNKALKIAQGKYVAIMDADDVSLPRRFEYQYNYLEKNRDIFLLGGGVNIINENGEIRSNPKFITSAIKIKKTMTLKRNCIAHPTVMFRNENKYFYRGKFRYAEDYDFYLTLLSDGKILQNTREILLNYRVSSGGAGRTRKGQEFLFAAKAREFYHQRMNNGHDKYAEFDKNSILNIDIEKTKNKVILTSEVKAHFEKNNFKEVRKSARKYFSNYGFLNKVMIYFLFSFTGVSFINFVRKFLH